MRGDLTSAAAIAIASFFAATIAGCDFGGWRLVDSGTTQTLRSVFVEAPNRVHIAGDEGTVLLWDGEIVTDTSTDAWEEFFVPDFYGIAASGDEISVAGDGGTIMTRRMSEWTFDSTRTSERLLTMLRPAGSIFYAAGENGRVLRRGVGDNAWERVDVGAPRGAKITGGWGINAGTIALATDRGVVLELTGGDWIAQTVLADSSTAAVPLFAVWSSTKGADLVTVGLSGSIFRRPEGETSWTREDTRMTQDLYGVFGSARDRVYAVGASGAILRFDGSSWSTVPSASSDDLFAVHGLADGSLIVAVGARGAIVALRGE